MRPGTDLVVALALHRYLFEEGHAAQAFLDQHTQGANELREKAKPWTFERAAEVSGVDASILRQVAERYVKTSPALVKAGWIQAATRINFLFTNSPMPRWESSRP